MKPELNKMTNQLNAFLQKLSKKKIVKAPKRLKTQQKSARENAFLAKRANFGTGNAQENNKDWYNKRQAYNNDKHNSYQSKSDEQFYNTANAIKKKGKFVEDKSLPGMVRFDGYWIKREAALKLKELKGTIYLCTVCLP